MTTITLDELRQLYDFDAEAALVSRTVQAALAEPERRVRFFARYTSWNGFFGSGVASFAGKIGRSRRLFLDPEETIAALADRSVYVASFFFDAARDEFDDRDTVHRDTHRCLAQAMLKGILQSDFGVGSDARRLTENQVDTLLREPPWLAALNQRVASGYGVGTPEDLPAIFASIGYHLGSELLADKEFTTIDHEMRHQTPALVEYLRTSQIQIAGQAHSGYQWVNIHSGHGGGAEADHFNWATQGVRLAFRFVPSARHDALRSEIHRGFLSFARDHREFFEHVNA